MTYTMRSNHDCGPSALSFATGHDYDRLVQAWGWKDCDDARDDLLDSPWHHFSALAKIGIPWEIKTCGDILQGKATPNKTVVLLHNASNPILQQHWVVFAGLTPTHVLVHWGDGTIKQFLPGDFAQAYAKGTPACAYEVGKGRTKLTWYQRLYVTITGKFI